MALYQLVEKIKLFKPVLADIMNCVLIIKMGILNMMEMDNLVNTEE